MTSSLKWAKVVAIVLVATVPALFAGGYEHHKCTESTQDCLDHMAAKMKTSGWVGIELEHNETDGTLTITKVVPGSPAEAAGLQPGDELYALNGIVINDKNEDALKKAKKEWQPGQTVNYTIKRNGQERPISVTLGQMPADVLARFIGEHMLEHASNELAAK
jgi:C-terminal processing protease CtpA/Prc